MTIAYVGLGSNLDEPRRQIEAAFAELDGMPHTRVLRRSSLYRSAPMGYADQPEFVNAVAQLDSRLSPAEFLKQLKQIEDRHGRKRSFPNAPRTLDLDLLLFNKTILGDADLILPHPRMHERAFVLKPLLEIAPDALIPGIGPAKICLEKLSSQKAEKIDG